MPAVCWNTPCTPQKQPPASTAVCRPSAACTSALGAGMTTASSAAREGTATKAAIASAPMAAAQSDRRLNWVMESSFGLGVEFWGQFSARGACFTMSAALFVYPSYGTQGDLLRCRRHESVNKIADNQGLKARFRERRA